MHMLKTIKIMKIQPHRHYASVKNPGSILEKLDQKSLLRIDCISMMIGMFTVGKESAGIVCASACSRALRTQAKRC